MQFRNSLRRLRDRLDIRQQSAALTVLLSLATVAIITLATASVVRRHAVDTANGDLRLLSQTMAMQLDQQMFERYREITNLANLAPLTSAWAGDARAIGLFLDEMQATLPNYAWIGYASADGTVRAATQRMLEGVSVAERPWFKAGLGGPITQDVHQAKLLEKLLPIPADGEPFRFVDVAAPVRDGRGAVAGVLGAHLSWTWARDMRDQLLAKIDPALRTEIWVTSADGTIVLGPAEGAQALTPAQVAATETGATVGAVEPSATGDYFLAAVRTQGLKSYSGLGWRVVARRPVAAALAGANGTIYTIMVIGTTAALLSSLAAALIAGRVTRPLSRLADDADRIGRDPTMSLIQRQSGSLDIVRLSNSLRSLVRRVDFAEAHLTAALAEAGRTEKAITQLRTLADTDPMTGLLNRRGFRALATEAQDFGGREQRGFGVMMIDIDHFKRINDTHGHAAGDAAIQAIAGLLSSSLRASDHIARFGGEEFVVLLRNVDETVIDIWAERTRKKIEDATIPWQGQRLKLTISIGATTVAADDRDIEDVIHRADRALYAAKSAGRNRVNFHASPLARSA